MSLSERAPQCDDAALGGLQIGDHEVEMAPVLGGFGFRDSLQPDRHFAAGRRSDQNLVCVSRSLQSMVTAIINGTSSGRGGASAAGGGSGSAIDELRDRHDGFHVG